MATKVEEAFVEVTARTSKFKKGLKGVGARLRKFAANLSQLGKRAGIAFGVALAAGIAISIKAAAEQEKVENRLASVLKATGFAAGLSAKALKDDASALQQLTGIGDEAIIANQAILLTFKNIKGDVFKAATRSILDMAEVLGQDAKQGAIQLGKALNDPILGVTALQRVGITFTQAQKDQIKAMVEAGNVMGAQRIILKELDSQFKGAANTVGKTTAGSFRLLKSEVGDVFEEVGFLIGESVGLVDILVSLAKTARNLIGTLKKLRDGFTFDRAIMRVQLFADEVKTRFEILGERVKALLAAIATFSIEPFERAERRITDILQLQSGRQAKIARKFAEATAAATKKDVEKRIADLKIGAAAEVDIVRKAEAKKRALRFIGFEQVVKAAQELAEAGAKQAIQKVAPKAQEPLIPAGPPVLKPLVPEDLLEALGLTDTVAESIRRRLVPDIPKLLSKESKADRKLISQGERASRERQEIVRAIRIPQPVLI